MARPQVADGGDGLQVWRVAADIINKQSRKVDKGWCSSLGVGRETTIHRRKIITIMKFYSLLGLVRNFGTNYVLDKGCDILKEYCVTLWTGFICVRIRSIDGIF
jgi:hypothetical protein